MAIQHSERKLTVRQLFKMKDVLRDDLSIQRQFVWEDDEDRKTLLIDSLMNGYYVPNIMAMDNGDGFLWIIDGKQRCNCVFSYLQDAFPLTEEVTNEELSGLCFSQLPKESQEEIESATVTIVEFKNLTEEEMSQLFFRLNHGVQISPIERLRSIAGTTVMEYVNTIASEPFFAERISISKTAKRRFEDQSMIFQIMMLFSNDGESVELSSSEIEQYVLAIKEQGLDDVAEKLKVVTKYLNDAFPIKDKNLKKSDVPILFVMADKALQMEVTPEQFGGWSQVFFKELKPGSEYKTAKGSGSAKKENVAKRLRAMGEDFDKNIKKAPNYQIPEPKTTGGRRGRKPKNQDIQVQTNVEGESA